MGYLLLERSPRRWWVWLWLASIPWALLMTVLWPVAIDPLYNRFEPMRREPLRTRIADLSRNAGVTDPEILQTDSSKRSTKLNAYVTGLGPTKRIVVFDTTLRALSEDEVVAIVGHEMGHYVLHHIWWGFVMAVIGGLGFLWLLSQILPRVIERFGPRFGITALNDLAGLPLVILVMSVLMFVQMPLVNAISRHQEHAADRYGLELTHLNRAMASSFVKFVTHDYADPDPPPFIVFWLYSHPPIRERVEFALHYRPAER